MRRMTALIAVVLFAAALLLAQERILTAAYMPFGAALPVLRAQPVALPAELRGKSESELRGQWREWEVATDAAIRRRLIEGEEDALAELLLFGTSFTDQPRATLADVQSAASGRPTRLLNARITDLISNLADPSGNERLVFSRELLLDKGLSFESPAALQHVRQYLLATLVRLRQERDLYQDAVSAAQQLSPVAQTRPSAETQAGGLVLETSLLTNLGVERALAEMKSSGLLDKGSVHRVAVIGPGLDFIDRQSGYDTYPQQTVQPFAVMDSLFRLELASPGSLDVVTFDISPRVNDHIQNARERAGRGRPYFLQLPRPAKGDWTDDAVRYWERFGETTGQPATPARLPKSARNMTIRAVRVTPENVQAVQPVNLNIVLQRLDVPGDTQPFDVIIATNILDYYDVFQQNLALRNIAYMLRPGGFLIANNQLTQIDGARFSLVGSVMTRYSANASDMDFCYQRNAAGPGLAP